MTSPAHHPAAFHTRPITETALPPVRHIGYRCAACGRLQIHLHPPCGCHRSALLHAIELTPADYARLVAGER